jgi:hypothetical protein
MSDVVRSARRLVTRSNDRRWLPFWALQATEIVVALVFVDISVHVARSGLLLGGAVALLALAVTANGPLGFVRLIGQGLHRHLMIAVSVALIVAPIIPALRPDVQGIIVVEFGAVGLLRLCTLTRTSDTGSTGWRGAPATGVVVDARVVETKVVDPRAQAPGAPGQTGASGAPGAPGRTDVGADSTARRAGRATGAVITSGKQAVTEHRPEVEAKVKRSIRSLGRMAGRLSSEAERPKNQEH